MAEGIDVLWNRAFISALLRDEMTFGRVDPIRRNTTCPLGLAAHGKHLCPLHRRLDNAMASMEKAFADSTLAEILHEPTTSVPLCDFPSISKLYDFRYVP